MLNLNDHSALIWDTQTFQVVQSLVFDGSPVFDITGLEVIRSINRVILYGPTRVKDKPVQNNWAAVLWDPTRHRTIAILSDTDSDMKLADLSDDGSRIVVCSSEDVCSVRDTESGELIQRLDLSQKGLMTVKISPNNAHLIIAGTNGASILEIESGQEVFHLQDTAGFVDAELSLDSE